MYSQAASGRFPLGDRTGVLRSAACCSILSQQNVRTSAKAIGEHDDRLSALTVTTICSDRGRAMRHTPVGFCGRVPQNPAVLCRTSDRRKVLLTKDRQGFLQTEAGGTRTLDPVIKS